ncbi:uncharacterized protein LOC135712014 [Ochlerotatus camptorhynchus]|uniref:uncharacterized protein LOC135712014 n=1 Tax=Ochlerotatus camptorhynchus TaxID=644619 RepID=UPI0031CED0DE
MSKFWEIENVYSERITTVAEGAVEEHFKTTHYRDETGRVVFDASAKTTTGVSLNDTLLVGPTVQNDIVSIILRFCIHLVVLTADVPKMYRQVWLHKDDCKYQLILWWDSDGNLKVFELRTVTYGVASSPHHATRVLIQLATDEGEEFPLANTEVLKAIPAEIQEKQLSFDDTGINNSIKTLGLIWNLKEDYFLFRTALVSWDVKVTKRIVLSEIGQLFDPLGFLGPIIVSAKLVMQDIWRLGLEWDDELPEELLQRWKQFRHQLPVVNQIRKPRCAFQDEAVTIELHGFSDASKRAYGAVVYIRSINKDGTIFVNLVASKSRVAPLKPSTIPRLELCGALLLADLVRKVVSAMQIRFDVVKLWCDSQIVLCWLKKSPLALNQFVANRFAAIVELTQDYQWGYIQSDDNPADEFMVEWFTVIMEFPSNIGDPEHLEESAIPEVKSAVVLAVMKCCPAIVLDRLSNYMRMQRAWVYVHRYIDIKVHKKQGFGDISADEIKKAEASILSVLQRECFGDLRKALHSNSIQRHPLRNLAPFLGDDGLIRVGGRLKYSAIPYDGKHQVLLPEKHHVTEAIIRGLHLEHFHVGQNGLLAIVRERYWPVRVRVAIKKIVSNCQVCARQRHIPGGQFMGNLPESRVNPAPPFSKVGIDYAGPFMLKLGGRSTKLYKAYVVVFVCMAVKAIHFELVSSLSTETFIAALQRFSSRRGLPSNIHSDNATTFVGANHELAALKELFEDQQHQLKVKSSVA